MKSSLDAICSKLKKSRQLVEVKVINSDPADSQPVHRDEVQDVNCNKSNGENFQHSQNYELENEINGNEKNVSILDLRRSHTNGTGDFNGNEKEPNSDPIRTGESKGQEEGSKGVHEFENTKENNLPLSSAGVDGDQQLATPGRDDDCVLNSSTGRKSRRKNVTPKNISEMKVLMDDFCYKMEEEALTAYCENTMGEHLSKNEELTAYCEHSMEEDLNNDKEDVPGKANYFGGVGKVEASILDLSRPKEVYETDEQGALDLSSSIKDSNRSVGVEDRITEVPSVKTEASVLKDYASNTVNELLSMYGYGEDGDTLTAKMPLNSFAARSILAADVGTEEKSSSAWPDSGDSGAESSHPQTVSPSPGSRTTSLFNHYKLHSFGAYDRYAKRYQTCDDCKQPECMSAQYKEHYHCTKCPTKVFLKKDEMNRHFKWHRKREESLQFGFMRFSPSDDCTKDYDSCVHNGKQTHYHCVERGCNKVYVSTSDVQMHANYHRKDSAIIRLGFQRFRATEDCATESCPFHGQRTTHFHCRKEGCNFTFKNKADIEKHKTYHQKDAVLSKDGFRKFMKYENCPYEGCRYSKVANHIHCIRQGCNYVLHSTSQLLSHRRKHERRDIESVYRCMQQATGGGMVFNPHLTSLAQQGYLPGLSQQFLGGLDLNSGQRSETSEPADLIGCSSPEPSTASAEDQWGKGEEDTKSSQEEPEDEHPQGEIRQEADGQLWMNRATVKQEPTEQFKVEPSSSLSGNGTAMESASSTMSKLLPFVSEKKEKDESWKKYLTRYTANDPCHSRCELLYKDHYHCNSSQCETLFRAKDGVREHARLHEQLDNVTKLAFMTYDTGAPCLMGCPHKGKKHYHCLWRDCSKVIGGSEPIFTRLQHHHIHEYSTSPNFTKRPLPFTATDLQRKRGRPPKYQKVHIPTVPKIVMSEREIQEELARKGLDDPIAYGYKKFLPAQLCPDDKCAYLMREHFHCVRERCHHATDCKDTLSLHCKDFHSYITIQPGFEFFDHNVNCRRPHCHNNKTNKHYHCVRHRCDYSFVRYTTMAQHDRKHKLAEAGLTPSPSIGVPTASILSSLSPTTSMPSPLLMSQDGSKLAMPILQQGGMVSTSTAPLLFPSPSISTLMPPLFSPFKLSASLPKVPSAILPAVCADNKMAFSSSAMALPLAKLLKTESFANSLQPQLSWAHMLQRMHYKSDGNCSRPFCKLKKRDHYHCYECEQAFSDPFRLKTHVQKHGTKLELIDTPGKGPETGPEATVSHVPSTDDSATDSDVEMAASNIPQVKTEIAPEPPNTGVEPRRSTRKRTVTSSTDCEDMEGSAGKRIHVKNDEELSQLMHTIRSTQAAFAEEASTPKRRLRAIKDFPVPSGFERIPYTDHCNQEACPYSGSQTHYHCDRPECRFSTPDRSRLDNHGERHRKTDSAMGDEFERFRSSQDCKREGCELHGKGTHYHCRLCAFICTDMSKVLVHRKQHARQGGLA